MNYPCYSNISWWRSVCERALTTELISEVTLTELKLSESSQWGMMIHNKIEREQHVEFLNSLVREGNVFGYEGEAINSCSLYTIILTLALDFNQVASFEIPLLIDTSADNIQIDQLEKHIITNLHGMRTEAHYNGLTSSSPLRH